MEKQKPALQVTDLSKAYGSVQALRSVSFAVEPGTVVALLGPNGAGKTTALQCILGITDFRGTVEVDGISVRDRGKEARRRIGYLPQTPALADSDTCAQALSFFASLKGVDKTAIPALLDLVDLKEYGRTRLAHLSGGMRQRLVLAAALLADPPLLLLDEPTASLDIEARHTFYELVLRLRSEGKTVILSTHLFDRLSELADRVIVLHQGTVAFDDTMEGLRKRSGEQRFVVHLNGTPPKTVMDALQQAGVDPGRVGPAEVNWEDVLRGPLATGGERGAGEEARR